MLFKTFLYLWKNFNDTSKEQDQLVAEAKTLKKKVKKTHNARLCIEKMLTYVEEQLATFWTTFATLLALVYVAISVPILAAAIFSRTKPLTKLISQN